MRRVLLATTALLCLAAPAAADVIGIGTFTSDHCNCGPQPGGFATITVTDHQNGILDISISLLNGNKFANGGQDAGFAFNLVGNPTITYSGLPATFDVVNSANNVQSAGDVNMNGFGQFEYGVDGTFNGSQGPTSLSFTISGTGLSLASFAELSTNPPGSDPAFMTLDIFAGSGPGLGNTGIVDLSGGPTPFSSVPGPIVGAGLPGFFAALGLLGLAKRRRQKVQV